MVERFETPDNKYWPLFEQWAKDNCIELGHPDDYEHFWDTWYDGFKSGLDVGLAKERIHD